MGKDDVRALHYLLVEHGWKTNGESTDGPSTAAAVKAYQRSMFRRATGMFGGITLRALHGLQVGHGLSMASTVGSSTWMRLFRTVFTRGPASHWVIVAGYEAGCST